MKTTEEYEIERNILSSELLNETSLLIISQGDNEEYPSVSLRYEKYGEVREKVFAQLTPDVRVEHNDQMIAIFHKKGKGLKRFKLVSVYDMTIHEFVGTSNMHLHYEATKYQGAKVKKLGAQKK